MKDVIEIPFLEPKAGRPVRGLPVADLRLNFRNEPLRVVLSYLSEAASLTIHVEPNVEVERPINIWNDALVDREHAVGLLKQALVQKGFAAIRKGGDLEIVRSQDAKKQCIALPALGFSVAA